LGHVRAFELKLVVLGGQLVYTHHELVAGEFRGDLRELLVELELFALVALRGETAQDGAGVTGRTAMEKGR
jgi:hypothetical protein